MNIPHKISRIIWIPLLVVIIGVPIVAWGVAVYGKGYSMLTLIGQFTGIVGAQLFSFSLLLSIRHHFIEYFFGGLDKLYLIHHRAGVIGFAFLAVHPVVLAFRLVGNSIEDVMWYLLPFGDAAVPSRSYGIYGFFGMLLLLFITFYGMMFSYKALKNMHRFMGLAFFFGALHMLTISGIIENNAVIKVSCLLMAVLGLLAFTYRTLLGTVLVSRYKYVVSSVTTIGQGLFEITLSPVGKNYMKHLPGQFAMLTFKNSATVSDEEHPFTLSSAPRDNGDVRFSIKALGDWTSLLGSLTKDSKATLEGPFGEFYYGNGTKSQVWVAGGIGVTPFVSFAESMMQQESIDYTVDFYYSVRSEKDGAYREVFEALSKKHPSIKFHFMPSDVAGYVTGEGIVKELADAKTRDIFVCGPPPMMAALMSSLVAEGVPSSHIHSEKFSLLK